MSQTTSKDDNLVKPIIDHVKSYSQATNDNIPVEVEDEPAKTKSFWLNLKDYMQIRDLPTREKVILELDKVLINNRFTLISHRNHLQGCYTIRSDIEHDVDNMSPLTFQRSIRFSENKEIIQVPLTPLKSAPTPRKEGTLVTVINSAQTPEQNEIDNKLFDQAFQRLGFAIAKPCLYQFEKDRQHFNDNRYVVLDTKDTNKIPKSVSLTHPRTKKPVSFWIRFKDQTYLCNRCGVDHSSQCPWLKAWYEEKK